MATLPAVTINGHVLLFIKEFVIGTFSSTICHVEKFQKYISMYYRRGGRKYIGNDQIVVWTQKKSILGFWNFTLSSNITQELLSQTRGFILNFSNARAIPTRCFTTGKSFKPRHPTDIIISSGNFPTKNYLNALNK